MVNPPTVKPDGKLRLPAGAARAFRIYLGCCLAVEFLPRIGPPDLLYPGSDLGRIVLNIGFPYTLFVCDPEYGAHAGISAFAMPVVQVMAAPLGFGVILALLEWLGRLARRSSARSFLRRLGTRLALALAFLVSLVCYRHWREGEMLRVTRIWGRLAPLPQSARGFAIRTEGSPFTRSFRSRFFAPLADIETWLAESPGPRETVPDPPAREDGNQSPYGRMVRLSETSRKYIIDPGGGAQWAEVVVDAATGEVRIYAYWS